MRTRRYFWALAAALLASCADYSVPDEVLYGEVVGTQGQPGFDFTTLDSYWLDPIVKVYKDDPQLPDHTFNLNDALYAPMKNAITSNMARLNYAPLGTQPTAGTAGAVILRMAVAQGTGTFWYGGYWCDPYYYYWCYYDWYYAGSYKYGTVMMSMTDVTSADTAGNADIVWIAAMYGVATSYGTVPTAQDVARVADATNRAFSQEPNIDAGATP